MIRLLLFACVFLLGGCSVKGYGGMVVGDTPLGTPSPLILLVQNNSPGTVVKNITSSGAVVGEKVGEGKDRKVVPIELRYGEKFGVRPEYYGGGQMMFHLTADIYSESTGEFIGPALPYSYTIYTYYGQVSQLPPPWFISQIAR